MRRAALPRFEEARLFDALPAFGRCLAGKQLVDPVQLGWRQSPPRSDVDGNSHIALTLGRSGKEVRFPSPPPLRTVRAPFDAYSSSIDQRLCAVRPGPAPPSDDTPSETRSPHWSWGRPERYCGSA